MKVLVILSLLVSSSVFAQPNQADMEKMRAAMDKCSSDLGIQRPQRGVRPSREDMEKLDACLQEQGIEKPAHHPRTGKGRDNHENQQEN